MRHHRRIPLAGVKPPKLPEAGSLERLMPRGQRPMGHMEHRTRQELISFRGFPRRHPVLWGSYSFDALFRLAWGMLIGFMFSAAGAGAILTTNEVPWWVLVALIPGPPTATLIGLALWWKKGPPRIRKHMFPKGLLLGCLHAAALALISAIFGVS